MYLCEWGQYNRESQSSTTTLLTVHNALIMEYMYLLLLYIIM